ncbi:hypothetical protein [Halomonas alkalisoli]|uniref:hypothetical protein n=1 Tax=Halomonas alkalisoli TaxID=2907158 RepID=UPI001F186460|nr:hypothetical protein [Halomonas alkalisoli]MCE9683391.1 hypothetical protein [Halomonas alkalisoli]
MQRKDVAAKAQVSVVPVAIRGSRVLLEVEDDFMEEAVAALRAAPPYEEPAFDVWKLESF